MNVGFSNRPLGVKKRESEFVNNFFGRFLSVSFSTHE
ncbi:hypothetical protein CF65_02167 [Aggregatibacter actinomycetemcomitans HK1651]|nr:hypothetical protein CF65_02167 [Aggregatibacter actinomycetemcomitans HK1651]